MSQPTDEFTGMPAQADLDFLSEGGDQSFTPAVDIDDFSGIEDQLNQITQDEIEDDAFLKNLDYEEFIILSKKELAEFIRIAEPWTKVTVDQYGKCIRIASEDADRVSLSYWNSPTYITQHVTNRSQKVLKNPFYIKVDILKRIVIESFASVVFVIENGEVNIALLDNLLYVETVSLKDSEYQLVQLPLAYNTEVDLETAVLVFKKMSFILNLSDRVAEKNVLIKDGKAYFSTNAFMARMNSPFKSDLSIAVFKPVADLIGSLVDASKLSLKVSLQNKGMLMMNCDGKIFAQAQVVTNIEQFFNPQVDQALSFNANMTVVNDSISHLMSIVKSFDYLNDTVSIQASQDELTVIVMNTDLTRKIPYKFAIQVDGKVEAVEMKVSSSAIKPYLDLAGKEAKYSLTEAGFGLETNFGRFLIRKRH